VARPVLREGRFYCPRCNSRLQFDQEDFVCLVCGYEYRLSEREMRNVARRNPAPVYQLGGGLIAALGLTMLAFGQRLVPLALLLFAGAMLLFARRSSRG